MKVKKHIALLLNFILLCAVAAGCSEQGGNESKKVGVSMPSKVERRWEQDSDSITKQLQAKAYVVDMQNAEDDIAKQNARYNR